jgi:hypothetical protein
MELIVQYKIYMTNTLKQLVTLVPLTLILVGLLSYNFMSAQWVGPTATAPNNNTEAPINTGSDPQDKVGVLGVNALAVFSGSPTIRYTDSNERDFWTHANQNNFYVLADRNDDGVWTGESPWPMLLFASTTPAGDFARFANEVRASEYCDEGGNNCWDPATGTGGTWGAWTDRTSSRLAGTWYRNNNSTGLMVFYRGGDNSVAWVSVTGTSVDQVNVGNHAADSGQRNTGSFIVPPGHYYQMTGGIVIVSELRLPI